MLPDLNLFYSYNNLVEKAYVITIKDNLSSEKLADRCISSCAKVEMPVEKWHAFDGTQSEIIAPSHLREDSVMRLLKVTDHYMTKGEVACALSHISLWSHCAQIDRPIVILEHDAVMLSKFTSHDSINSIVYLGGAEWIKKNWKIYPIPPHASDGPNVHFICRAHAYSIDPQIAKNLLAHVIKYGICAPLDIMMRTDLFNITHQGVFAYDENVDSSTTIKNRPTDGRTTSRNDGLKF